MHTMSFGKLFTGSNQGKTTPPGRKARGFGVPRSYVRSFLESGLARPWLLRRRLCFGRRRHLGGTKVLFAQCVDRGPTQFQLPREKRAGTHPATPQPLCLSLGARARWLVVRRSRSARRRRSTAASRSPTRTSSTTRGTWRPPYQTQRR